MAKLGLILQIVADCQGKDCHQVVFGDVLMRREDTYFGCPRRADAAEALCQIGFMLAYRQGRSIGIYLKIVIHLERRYRKR